jgi:glycosyltransferase involved in cell wall biosynthesis
MTEKISLIIPSKNEVESLGAVLSELNNNNFIDEIIIVVDDKNDNSISVAQKYDCKIVIQEKKGYGSAIITGYKNAKNKFGCIFNADFSFDPKYFEELIKKSQSNDFIFGTRYEKQSGSDDDDIVTYVGNKVFSFITKYILGIKLTDILFTYVLCDVKKFNLLDFQSNDFRLCIELPVKVKKNKFTYSEVPMFERKRFAGKKKVNVIKDGFLILIEIIKSIKTMI